MAMPVIRRGELEDLTIPLPPLAIQARIRDLVELNGEEQTLMRELAEQKRILVEGVCRNLCENETGKGDSA